MKSSKRKNTREEEEEDKFGWTRRMNKVELAVIFSKFSNLGD